MADPSAPERALSRVGRRFLAGQLHAARQLAWCFAPYVNSYRRYVPGSWAPTAAVWGEDNRTCGFRVVGRGPAAGWRAGCPAPTSTPTWPSPRRSPAVSTASTTSWSSTSPYAGQRLRGHRLPRIPSTLVEALGELEHSEVAAEAFGADVHHHLAQHRPPGVGCRQPGRHRLGAGPELRADLSRAGQRGSFCGDRYAPCSRRPFSRLWMPFGLLVEIDELVQPARRRPRPRPGRVVARP